MVELVSIERKSNYKLAMKNVVIIVPHNTINNVPQSRSLTVILQVRSRVDVVKLVLSIVQLTRRRVQVKET